MRLAVSSIFTVVVGGLAVGGACQSTETGAATPEGGLNSPSRTATLYFTSELLGQVEPCGCRSRPLGGVQRIAQIVDRPAAAWLDTGDFLFPAAMGDHEVAQHVSKARHLARIFRLAGGIALNVGPTDAHRGAALLRELQREGALPLVSANIRPVGDGGPSVARSYLRKVGDTRVGVTGLATPESFADLQGLAALEYGPLLSSEVGALREDGAEVVVVLAQLDRAHATKLAAAVGGIDLLLHGSRPDDGWGEPSPTTQVGQTIIVDGGFKGRYVGALRMSFPPSPTGEPVRLRDPERSDRLKARIDTYESELRRLVARGAPEAVLASRRERLAATRSELEAHEVSAAKPPWIEVTRIPVDGERPAHPEAADVLAAYHGELVRLNWEAGDGAPCRLGEDQPSYVGSEVCAGCHPEAYAFWQNTSHARAWSTLVQREKQGDLTCVGCHSVGYREPGGFCRLSNIGLLRNVGCESCHGPGSRHIMVGDPGTIGRGLGERTCAGTCHVAEHSDQFHYGTYLQVVTGPGHPLTTREP